MSIFSEKLNFYTPSYIISWINQGDFKGMKVMEKFIKFKFLIFTVILCFVGNGLFSLAQETFNASITKDSVNSYPDSLILDETPVVSSQQYDKNEPAEETTSAQNDENDNVYKAETLDLKQKNSSNSQIYNISLKSPQKYSEDTIANVKDNIYAGNYSKAESSMDRLVTSKKLSALDMAEIASYYEVIHKPHKAFFAYDKALEIQPNRIEML